MSCRRAFDVDLAAYLVEPRAAAWDDFREHWPRCTACAAEVAAWTALQSRLGTAGHPDPERLLRWADGNDGLPAAERLALARHVEACPTCTDELRALARFDVAPHLEQRPPPAPPRPSVLRRVLWNPAVAYALLLLALAPTLLQRHEEASREVLAPAPATTPPSVAEGPAETTAQPSAEPAPADRPARRASQDAEADRRPEPKRSAPPARVAEGAPAGGGAVAPAPPPAAPAAQAPATAEAPAERLRGLGALGRRGEPDTEKREEARPFLSVELPDAARTAGVVELRVRDDARDRELRERFAVHPDLAMLSFELPPSWRDHRTYEVELRVPGTDVVERHTITVP